MVMDRKSKCREHLLWTLEDKFELQRNIIFQFTINPDYLLLLFLATKVEWHHSHLSHEFLQILKRTVFIALLITDSIISQITPSTSLLMSPEK